MKKHNQTVVVASPPIYRMLLWSGLMLGFAVRLFRLGGESLWYDETVSVYLAQQPVHELIAHTARDIHPPGYYLLLHIWQALTQPSLQHGLEFLYAWPSVAAGMVLLPLLYALGRRWFGPRVALMTLWFGALHPFGVWYSQEVRMYTVGAALCLLCLWAADKWTATRSWRQLVTYAVAGAAALYVLYYAAFALAAINLIVIVRIWRQAAAQRSRTILHWLLAQAGVLVLWSPWLPTFWRQVTDPPVPPWRGDLNLFAALLESLGALLVGQSSPAAPAMWAIVVLVLIAAASNRYTKNQAILSLLFFLFAPLLMILLLSVAVTPLYHVRYFFTYAAIAPILLALGVDAVTRRRGALWIGVVAVLAVNIWSLSEFWHNPLYRADDHRAAVQMLATSWRPNDAILVNAGWAYPVLSVYWPEEAGEALSAVPPPLQDRSRLPGYANPTAGPSLITTGSVDGAPSLGWGLAESDFYAMPSAEAQAALARVAADHARIWHYRLYDTVSDPAGLMRAELDMLGTLTVDMPFPGRDFVRVQRFDITPADSPFCPDSGVAARYGDVLALVGSDAPQAAQPGRILYTTLCWEALANVGAYPAGLRASLRLYDENDQMIAQIDDGPLQGTNTWQPGQRGRIPLGLPVPASTAPGRYFLDLIVYDGANGEPLQAGEQENSRLRLSTVEVNE